MIWNIIGDIHGEKYPFKENSIVLGDFSLKGYSHYNPEFPIYFIDGNHDAYDVINPNNTTIQMVNKNVWYIPRGYSINNVLFVGGGDSIDKNQRIPGYDWWSEETITYRQMLRISSIKKKIEVILSHDGPEFLFSFYQPSPSRLLLQEIFEIFRPKLWIYGHHHKFSDNLVRDCRFMCLGIKQEIKYDLNIEI